MRSFLVLGLVPLLASTAFAANAPAPPSPSAVSDLLIDYYGVSQNLENEMIVVAKSVTACRPLGLTLGSELVKGQPPGDIFSTSMASAAGGLGNDREQFKKAFMAAQATVSAQMAIINKNGGSGQNDAGKKAIEAAKSVVSTSIDGPIAMIDQMTAKAAPGLQRMDDQKTNAFRVLSDSNATCQQARAHYITVFGLAHQLPKKVAALRAGLVQRNADVQAWADQIKTQNVTNASTIAQK